MMSKFLEILLDVLLLSILYFLIKCYPDASILAVGMYGLIQYVLGLHKGANL